jgi:hypothetical protein
VEIPALTIDIGVLNTNVFETTPKTAGNGRRKGKVVVILVIGATGTLAALSGL